MQPEKPILRKRESAQRGSEPSAFPIQPEGFGWSVLWLFLTQGAWEGGEARVTGTVLLFAEQGRLKACLSDRDSESVGFITLSGEGDPMDEVEDALRNDAVDWRAAGARNRRKG